MVIIWGPKGRRVTTDKGQFLCPHCRALRPYKRKKAAKDFTLYFIPLFETERYGEYVECQVCENAYEPEVLEYSASLQRHLELQEQQMAEAATQLARQLDSGTSLNAATASLMAAGADKGAVIRLLHAATGGNIRHCATCDIAFSGTLQYCSGCGGPLS